MAQRPLLQWPTEQGALYTVMMLDEGIERLGGLQYVHWMVENVPGNMVRNPSVGLVLQVSGVPGG